jgi:hypothetical protein
VFGISCWNQTNSNSCLEVQTMELEVLLRLDDIKLCT